MQGFAQQGGGLGDTHKKCTSEANCVEKCSNLVFGLGRVIWPQSLDLDGRALREAWFGDTSGWRRRLFFEGFGPSPRDPLPCGKGPCGVVGFSFESRSLRVSPDLLYRSV
jgi:hypothetical protein